ncbi:DHH family phosphoesterase [Emergencia sp. 1XD21-10]|uniref:DHH family phosphoesterase n=1 Tax=Emergencia sp. 1XD21-10 TaxID=2304569 RepID=UPI00137B49E7|nr:DHH family phosphoesterase [Emergencia sp. 1XD21-10]NCE99382.1 DHH family phosphoesterase [Emergencia sp. 1XD21-10]
MAKILFEKEISSKIPLPVCIINSKGKVVSANEHIGDVFIYDGIEDADFFALTGIKTSDLYSKVDEGTHFFLERNGKQFKLIISRESGEEDANLLVFFYDITNFENLKDRYNDERVCVLRIVIDNYDEFEASTLPEMRMRITAAADSVIRQWAAKNEGSINKLNNSQYVMYCQYSHLENIIENKFGILDEIRQIETEADFPMSLSIGVGVGGKNLITTEEYSRAAMDLARGRGGDQAVIKRVSKIEYYGGKMQTVEKGNKGKSRVIAHALKQLIEQSKKVIIMGHVHPDMDCFGSALGIHRLCAMCGRTAYILLDEVIGSLQEIYEQAKESDNYIFVNNKKAESLADEDTLLIIVDTHRPSYVENRNLLTMTERIVVIDHHRKAEDYVENPILSYIESYASSTAELVSEILQYAAPKKTLIKLEAEALLAGMTIDTNRFAVKTGVRTFEAAAWLRRSGADTAEVKRFFQTDLEAFKIRAKCIAAADFHEKGVATSICEGCNEDAQVVNSQVADELLTIKDIKASFVAGRTSQGKTVISARSLGEINVQVIMEKLGGGGHLTTAGAQVDGSPEEVIEKVLELLK